jgi:hypothetical protein
MVVAPRVQRANSPSILKLRPSPLSPDDADDF